MGGTPGKPLTINNITYPSIGAAARALNMNRQALAYRIKHNKPLDAPVQSSKTAITIDGIRYESLKACAEALRIPRHKLTLSNWSRKGQRK